MDSKLIVREEKLRRQEELRLRVQQLREERNKRLQQRIQLLKTINTQRVMNQTLPAENFPEKKSEKQMNHSISITNKPNIKAKPEPSSLLVNKKPQSKDLLKTSKPNSMKNSVFPLNIKQNILEKKPIVISQINKITLQNGKTTNVNKKPANPIINNRKSIMPTSNINKFEVPKLNNRKSIMPTSNIDKSDVPKLNNRKSVMPKSSVTKFETSSKSLVNNPLPKREPLNIPLFANKNMTTFSVLSKMSNKNTVSIDKSVSESKSVNTKRWTMAAVERLSKPRIINKPIPAANNLNINVKIVKTNRQSVHPKIQNGNNDNNHANGLRRSLSTVHFKRLGPEEVQKCFKRTYSSGNLKRREIEEELPAIFPPKGYFLPIASERKKSVSFLTPSRKSSTPRTFLNTPKPSELRKRLNDWLQKRGKSLSTFHHLKCFGIESHGIPSTILNQENNDNADDENKENIEVLDDDSFEENITGTVKNMATNWRQTNVASPEGSVTVHPSPISNMKSRILTELTPKAGPNSSIDPLLVEALFDLHQLILEDYSWLHCAEWLRLIIREGGEKVKDIAEYWECRAALEEKRGDFVRTVDCFNNALQRGSQPTNIEASLDNLLDKFMKLNLDPNCDNGIQPMNQKLINVKNVFKTSLIRFAIKRENDNNDKTKYIATPVRRSSRLTNVNSTPVVKRSPRNNSDEISKTNGTNGHLNTKSQSALKSGGRKHLVQLCESLRNVENDVKQTLIFVPNKALNFNDCV